MEGVTTAIVGFLLVCVVFPRIVKRKSPYYAAFGAIVIVILLAGFEAIIDTNGFHAFGYFLTCLLQVAALILLILAAGGLTFKQLLGEVNEAIESVRHAQPQSPAAPTPPPPGGTESPKVTLNE